MYRVAVQDATILIDLEMTGLFDLWLQLGIETHTTDFITRQLEKGVHEIARYYTHSKDRECLLAKQLHKQKGSPSVFPRSLLGPYALRSPADDIR